MWVRRPETEMKEKKARVEDALNATRAAVEEGLSPVAGGYLRTLRPLDKMKLEGDKKSGWNIVRRALEDPSVRSPTTRARKGPWCGKSEEREGGLRVRCVQG